MVVIVISLHVSHEHVTNEVLESSILRQAALCSDDHVSHHVHVVHAGCVARRVQLQCAETHHHKLCQARGCVPCQSTAQSAHCSQKNQA